MNWTEIIIFICILSIIVWLFINSHLEIKRSLEKTRKSEEELEKEKALLLKKIGSQDQEIKQEKQKRLAELSKMAEFGRLSQGLFHDLLTPLTSIVLQIEKLKDVKKEELALTQQNLDKAVSASRRMATYIHNIRQNLQQSRVVESCSLTEELEKVLDLFAFKIRGDQVQIVRKHWEQVTWTGEIMKIRQIFSNLISNALDALEHVDRQKKVLELSLFMTDKKIVFQVSDNGEGISAENQKKIFEPFFSTKSKEKGTGLGLSMVKSIVEKNLGGKILLESHENRGTIFTVLFPKTMIKE